MERIIQLEAYSLYKDARGLVTVSNAGIKGFIPCKGIDIDRLEQAAIAYKGASQADKALLSAGISSYLLGLKAMARAESLLSNYSVCITRV